MTAEFWSEKEQVFFDEFSYELGIQETWEKAKADGCQNIAEILNSFNQNSEKSRNSGENKLSQNFSGNSDRKNS